MTAAKFPFLFHHYFTLFLVGSIPENAAPRDYGNPSSRFARGQSQPYFLISVLSTASLFIRQRSANIVQRF